MSWEGWEIESDSSDSSPDSGGWIDVKGDGEVHLSLSDSKDEDEKPDGPAVDANRTSTLATTKICYIHR